MPKDKPGLGWGEKIGLGLLLVSLGILVCRPGAPTTDLVPVGTPLPELMAEGWLNVGEPSPSPSPEGRGIHGTPTREGLAGKVVVIDFWATWCGPCRASMPKLAKIHQRYRPLGVEFIGLTDEPVAVLPAIEGFVKSVEGFTWPVGYGAGPTLDMLGITGLPTLVVFGKDGRAVWSGSTTWEVDLALDEALSR